MNDVWQEFTVLVAPNDHHLDEAVLLRQVGGRDAIYSATEQLGILFPTMTDKVMFRLALLRETKMHDVHPLGRRHHVAAPRFSEKVAENMAWNTFEASITPVTVGRLEFRGKAAFDRIEADLAAGQTPFAFMPALIPSKAESGYRSSPPSPASRPFAAA